MSIKNFLFIIILLVLVFFSPVATHAANEYHLVACSTWWNNVIQGPTQSGNTVAPPFCNICDLFVLLQTAFQFVWFYLSIPIAAAMMLYGGFLMILPSFGGQSSSQLTKGRKILTNAVLGLAIIFFAWIGVDSILKILGASQTDRFGPWNKIVCTADTVSVAQPQPGSGGGIQPIRPPVQLPPTTTYTGGSKLTEAGAQKYIADRGMTTQANVKLSGVKEGTLETAADTKDQCGCQIIITSATGGVHANGEFSHANGDKVDIKRNDQLDSFIQNNYRYIGRRGGDLAGLYVNDRTGALYAKEGSHWDVLNGNSWEMSRKTKK